MTKIHLITPNIILENPKGKIYYPLWIFHYEIGLKRLLLKPKIEELFILVDGTRCIPSRCDSIPHSEEIEISEKLLAPLNIKIGEAEILARRVINKYLMTRYLSWWKPQIKIIKEQLLYQIFWIEKDSKKDSNEMILINSITGERSN